MHSYFNLVATLLLVTSFF